MGFLIIWSDPMRKSAGISAFSPSLLHPENLFSRAPEKSENLSNPFKNPVKEDSTPVEFISLSSWISNDLKWSVLFTDVLKYALHW